jgi:hypothetical protein
MTLLSDRLLEPDVVNLPARGARHHMVGGVI